MGEFLSLFVAICWTGTALFADIASHKVGAGVLNVWRMILALPMLAITLYFLTGSPMPLDTTPEVWGWLLASGFVGYVFGDFCLFNAYIAIGSRFGQLFMTLASPFAAIAAFMLLGEEMGMKALLGMFITITGIGMSILGKGDEGKKLNLNLPLKGILLGIGAGLGQGVGLVLSKVGMEVWNEHLSTLDVTSTFGDPDSIRFALVVAFAATMMRGIMGLLGFSATMLIRREQHGFLAPVRSFENAFPTLMAVILGPFAGVSLSLLAVHLTNAGIAQTLMSLTPVFILWPSRLLFKTRIRFIEVVGAIIAVCGAALFFI